MRFPSRSHTEHHPSKPCRKSLARDPHTSGRSSQGAGAARQCTPRTRGCCLSPHHSSSPNSSARVEKILARKHASDSSECIWAEPETAAETVLYRRGYSSMATTCSAGRGRVALTLQFCIWTRTSPGATALLQPVFRFTLARDDRDSLPQPLCGLAPAR